MKRPGKPKKYTKEMLKQILLDYIQKNPNNKVSYLQLEKETGISRNTWARNMKDEILYVNEPLPIVKSLKENDYFLPLPNVAELVKNNYQNRTKLIEALNHMNQSIQNLYLQAKRAYELEKKNQSLVEKIEKLKIEKQKDMATIKTLKQQVQHYSQAYRDIVVSSTYGEKGLKNVLEFKKGDSKNKDKITSDLVKQFDMFKPKST